MDDDAVVGVDAFRLAARSALADTAATVGWRQLDNVADQRSLLRAFDRELHRRGWSGLSLPRTAGGQGMGLDQQIVFFEEASRLGVPTPYNRVALGIVAPALLSFGTEQQIQRYLPPMIACEEIWCQGFSEPEAGSDLAAVSTRAVRAGAEGTWEITGHKVWTTLASDAHLCFLLARTGPVQSRHRGITAFLIPMSATGVTVRPIVQIDSNREFAEVLFDGVVIDDSARLGSVDGGWAVAMTALAYERSVNLLQRQLDLDRRLRGFDLRDNSGDTASRLLDLQIASRAMKHSIRLQLTAIASGRDPGVDANATKVYWSETYQALTRLQAEQATTDGDGLAGAWGEYYASLSTSIYAGTNEVQRNIIAERGLGLPR